MNKILLVTNDDLPDIHFQIIDETTELPVDVSNPDITVYFKFREKGTATVLFTKSCDKLFGGYAGQCKLVWPSDGMDVTYGVYEGEVYLDIDGDIQTIYERIPFRLRDDF